jgi:diguanylate cyclase (GGDEF)-like protein
MSDIALYQNRNRAATEEGRALLGLLKRKTNVAAAGATLQQQAHSMVSRAEETIAKLDTRIAALQDILTVDETTGLLNRRGFCNALVRELGRCERGLSAGGLMAFIEIDNFRIISDTHGMMAGEACLRLVARALEADIRAMDAAARLGTDEFALLLADTTKRDVAGRVQDLGWRLNNLSLAWYGEIIPVRAGLGLKSYGKGDRADGIFGETATPRPQESGLTTTKDAQHG